MKKNKLAKMIDHTLLKPEATMFDVINLCEEAKKYGFFQYVLILQGFLLHMKY